MTLYRDVQARAQIELDEIVGQDRLPAYSDREKLPYLSALIKELLRFSVVAPTGFPHRARSDDIHEGYFIPKDTLIIQNLWCVLLAPISSQILHHCTWQAHTARS
jgi:cytochrome P450